MHEYSVVSALIDRIEAEARAHRATSVQRVRVKIGELSGVDAGLLATAYATFREKTICDGADLDIERVAPRWACPACKADVAADGPPRCTACGAAARLEAGDEIVLDRIEMEVE